MVKKLSLPVILVIGMILCGPGASSSSSNNQGCPGDIFKDYDDGFASYRPGDAISYKPMGYQKRSSNAVPGERDGRGPAWGDQRSRSWSDRITTDALLEFLKVHEKELASRLESMRTDRARNFSDQVRALKSLYGPVIEQMKEDPKAGKMSLEKIRHRLKIPDAVAEVKKSSPDAEEAAKTKLTDYVSKLFDVIVSEEEYDIDQMEEWLNHPEDRRSLSRSEYWSNRNYIEENRDDISDWKKKKNEIVADRVKKLLQEHRDFPWGN